MGKFIPSAPEAVKGALIALLAIMVVNKVPAVRRIVGPGA